MSRLAIMNIADITRYTGNFISSWDSFGDKYNCKVCILVQILLLTRLESG